MDSAICDTGIGSDGPEGDASEMGFPDRCVTRDRRSLVSGSRASNAGTNEGNIGSVLHAHSPAGSSAFTVAFALAMRPRSSKPALAMWKA